MNFSIMLPWNGILVLCVVLTSISVYNYTLSKIGGVCKSSPIFIADNLSDDEEGTNSHAKQIVIGSPLGLSSGKKRQYDHTGSSLLSPSLSVHDNDHNIAASNSKRKKGEKSCPTKEKRKLVLDMDDDDDFM